MNFLKMKHTNDKRSICPIISRGVNRFLIFDSREDAGGLIIIMNIRALEGLRARMEDGLRQWSAVFEADRKNKHDCTARIEISRTGWANYADSRVC